MAGESLTHCCTLNDVLTVKKEATAYNGLWRWAARLDYVESNPWFDQSAGLSRTLPYF